MTSRATEPSAKCMAVVITRRPFQMVATQANTWMVVKIEIIMLPALKKLMAMSDMPTVNM